MTAQVVSFLRRRLGTGEVLGEEPLDLPARTLRTRAVWWTLPPEQVAAAGARPGRPAGRGARRRARLDRPAAAVRDLRPLGHRRGLDRAAPGHRAAHACSCTTATPAGPGSPSAGTSDAAEWLLATREAIAACGCESGCPSCVQSPKCGNGNDPLDKAGAVGLLDRLLAGVPG